MAMFVALKNEMDSWPYVAFWCAKATMAINVAICNLMETSPYVALLLTQDYHGDGYRHSIPALKFTTVTILRQ